MDRKQTLQTALADIQKGAYSSALENLEKVRPKDNTVQYWSGVCAYKLQKFDLAAKRLKAPAEDKAFEDAPYLLGQSYYALQEYRKAEPAFQKSLERNYKQGATLYYLGYISNVLEREDKALEYYDRILALPASDSDMKLPAQFQIGEVHFERAKDLTGNDKKAARKKIFLEQATPAYKRVIEMDAESALAMQAKGRLDEIQRRLGVDVPHTKSGAAVPARAWVVRASEDVKYDTNIINEADNRTIKVSNAGSLYEKTSLFGKYEYIWKNWLALTPELSLDGSYHFRRGNPSVYANDNTNATPAVRARLDHMVKGKPAGGLVEYEFAYGTRDYLSTKTQRYYTRSSNIIIGERIEYFAIGGTSLKFNLKLSENQNRAQNFLGPAVSLSQIWTLVKPYVLSSIFTFELQRAKSTFYDQRIYKLNLSYGIPKIYWNTSADLAFGFTVTDTMNQQATRGFEKTIAPILTLTRFIDKADKFAVNFNYAYTRNNSSDKTNYAYAKHVIGLGGQYTF